MGDMCGQGVCACGKTEKSEVKKKKIVITTTTTTVIVIIIINKNAFAGGRPIDVFLTAAARVYFLLYRYLTYVLNKIIIFL